MARVIGVRFRDNGKIYYFASEQFEVEVGQNVIVETARNRVHRLFAIAEHDGGRFVVPNDLSWMQARKATFKIIEGFSLSRTMLIICLMSTLVVPLGVPIVTCTGHRIYRFAIASTLGGIVAENIMV